MDQLRRRVHDLLQQGIQVQLGSNRFADFDESRQLFYALQEITLGPSIAAVHPFSQPRQIAARSFWPYCWHGYRHLY